VQPPKPAKSIPVQRKEIHQRWLKPAGSERTLQDRSAQVALDPPQTDLLAVRADLGYWWNHHLEGVSSRQSKEEVSVSDKNLAIR
jgi:hypothetical protein